MRYLPILLNMDTRAPTFRKVYIQLDEFDLLNPMWPVKFVATHIVNR